MPCQGVEGPKAKIIFYSEFSNKHLSHKFCKTIYLIFINIYI